MHRFIWHICHQREVLRAMQGVKHSINTSAVTLLSALSLNFPFILSVSVCISDIFIFLLLRPSSLYLYVTSSYYSISFNLRVVLLLYSSRVPCS